MDANQPGVEGLRPGDPGRIGEYRLLGRLGEGGMGTVYLARTPQGRLVAVKVIKPEVAVEDGFAERFHAEVRNARRVASFCTAQVLGDGNAADGRPYMVTEYIPGTPLSRQISGYGALDPAQLHGVALGVAAALAAIHVAGLVHRDLKPANVILSLSGPRVIDFGVARALDSTHGFTRSGEVLGSPGWWAPEQVKGLEITPAADVFAWGCLIAYAGNGRHPYGRGDMITMATRLLNTPPDLGAPRAPLDDLGADNGPRYIIGGGDQNIGGRENTVTSAAPLSSLEREFVRLVNVQRRRAGCAPFRVDRRLVQSARAHSAEMAASDVFSHTSPDGRSPWQRMEAAGYRNGGAENIGRGFATAAEAVRGWLASSSHRGNILNCSLKATGVGVMGGISGPWWTQDFGYS
ncbi:protein kinase [Streptosporangium algeriense]|uniref:Protein kinase n=1 Tax=Streptosporangium algeriense TaxID=1682748 RepID=A0ABW3DXX8_9ACTN